MARKARRKFAMKEGEMPLSAMIDIVFQLLIYFVVTQKPILEETFLSVDLPAPDKISKPPPTPPKLFTIDICKMMPNPVEDLNYYYVNGQKYTFDDLRKQLIRQGEFDPKTTIILNCDPNAKHQKLIRILDTCAEANLTCLNLIKDTTVQFAPDAGTIGK
jgi:biopolymer transport protein ExbD